MLTTKESMDARSSDGIFQIEFVSWNLKMISIETMTLQLKSSKVQEQRTRASRSTSLLPPSCLQVKTDVVSFPLSMIRRQLTTNRGLTELNCALLFWWHLKMFPSLGMFIVVECLCSSIFSGRTRRALVESVSMQRRLFSQQWGNNTAAH